MLVKINNRFINIEMFEYETIEMFYFRINYILKQQIKTKEELEKAVINSKYELCKFYYNCEY
jgi:hypothetical protein